MARGASKSDIQRVRPEPEVMNYNSISLPPKAPIDPEQKKLDKALRAAKKGATKAEKAEVEERAYAYRTAEVLRKAYIDSEEYKAVEALRDKHSEVKEQYNYDLPPSYYREWNKDAPQSAKDASDAATKKLKELDEKSGVAFRDWDRLRESMIAKEGIKNRANQTLPDLPGIRRDKEGYFDIDDLRRSPEGAAQLAKITNATLKQVTKSLARGAASEAGLLGEDRGGFIGEVEQTETVSAPSKNRSGSKFANLEFKMVAEVDYKNDPYGDSSTHVKDYKVYVRSRG